MKIVWILAFAVMFGLAARAATLDDKIKAFTDALNTNTAVKNGADPMMLRRIPAIAEELENSTNAPGGDANLTAMVRQLMAMDPSPAVQSTGKALLDELAAQKKARLDEQTARVDAVLDRVPALLIKAQKPSELDGILGDLQKVEIPQNGMYGYDADAQRLAGEVTNTYQFVAQWQDYLSDLGSGNFQGAQSVLQNLSNSRAVGDRTLVPRSEILARAAALQGKTSTSPHNAAPPAGAPEIDEDAILARVKTLDDLEPALKALLAGQRQDNTSNQIAQMVELYATAREGLPVMFDFSSINYNGGNATPDVLRIKSMLLLYLLPRYIGPGAPAPNPDETVNAYLQRAIGAAEAKEDWITLQRILTVETRINRLQVNPSGTQGFIAGLNQEMAGQYDLAVTSYQNALRQPDDFLPVKVVGDRLAAIKKDHPADFDAGMKAFQNPPAPTYLNPAMMRGYPPAFMIPGYPNPAAMRAAMTAAVTAAAATTNAPAAAPPSANAAPVHAVPPK